MIDMMITCASGEALSRGYAGFDTAMRAAEQEAFRLGEPVFEGFLRAVWARSMPGKYPF